MRSISDRWRKKEESESKTKSSTEDCQMSIGLGSHRVDKGRNLRHGRDSNQHRGRNSSLRKRDIEEISQTSTSGRRRSLDPRTSSSEYHHGLCERSPGQAR